MQGYIKGGSKRTPKKSNNSLGCTIHTQLSPEVEKQLASVLAPSDDKKNKKRKR